MSCLNKSLTRYMDNGFYLLVLIYQIAFTTALSDYEAVDKINKTNLTSNKSTVFREKPDYGDIRMAQNDMLLSGKNSVENTADSIISPSMESITKNARLKEQRDKLAKYLGTEDIYSLTSHTLWEKIRKFILDHWKELCPDGYLSIPLTIRYGFCVYIVMMIPAEVAFPFPSLYRYLLPKKTTKIQILNDFFLELDNFLSFAKEKSREQFLISFYVGKEISLRDDIDFLLKIPDLITTDPVKILRWLLQFEVRSDGYKPLGGLK
ncbi:hypothetical protein PAEPH01_0017 [Pancytospora epiphaga]|nr:hypothetical protein PAEPH01_0017 [Pancytospora epiphaga]